jgi:hypothetical protein
MYQEYEGLIVLFEFSLDQSTITLKLKQTTKIGDLLSYIGGIITSMLLVFRFITKKYSTFNSDLKVYESLDTYTTISAHDKTDSTLEPSSEKSCERQYWKKLSIYLGYFSPMSFMWCCFWRRGTRIKKRIKKIKRIQEVIKDKFDIRKIIVDIASLIYNQRNILKELKMTSPRINLMK